MMDQAAATPLKRAVEADDVALAVMACISHLKYTTGSVITSMPAGTCEAIQAAPRAGGGDDSVPARL
jgi:hypothetical protein